MTHQPDSWFPQEAEKETTWWISLPTTFLRNAHVSTLNFVCIQNGRRVGKTMKAVSDVLTFLKQENSSLTICCDDSQKMNYLKKIPDELKPKVKFQTTQKMCHFDMKRTPLRRRSKKGAKLDREYSVLAKKFKKENPQCQICWKAPTTDVHHSHKRGKHLLDVGLWIASCRSCHQWIHNNPGEARSRGLLK